MHWWRASKAEIRTVMMVIFCLFEWKWLAEKKKENVSEAEGKEPLFKRLRVVKQLCGNPRGSLPKTVKLIFIKSSFLFKENCPFKSAHIHDVWAIKHTIVFKVGGIFFSFQMFLSLSGMKEFCFWFLEMFLFVLHIWRVQERFSVRSQI